MTKTTGQFPKRRESDAQQERRVGQLKARMESWKEEQLERWGNKRAVFLTKNIGNGKNRDLTKRESNDENADNSGHSRETESPAFYSK